MIDNKLYTLLKVYECRNYTRAAQQLSITQPAVSQHIKALESELGVKLFEHANGELLVTRQCEEAVKFAKKIVGLYNNFYQSMRDDKSRATHLTIGITHTAESNAIAEALAKYCAENEGTSIKMITDSINNLYTMLKTYELDLAIVDGTYGDPRFSSMLLDTDYLTCVMSVDNPLARKGAVTLAELRRQKMILRTPASATRTLVESALESNGESIQSFDVTLEVDNIATIKDLIRKDLGVSILQRSACLDELRKGKIAALPVENLSMVRETRIVYNKDFTHTDMLNEIIKTYGSIVMN